LRSGAGESEGDGTRRERATLNPAPRRRFQKPPWKVGNERRNNTKGEGRGGIVSGLIVRRVLGRRLSPRKGQDTEKAREKTREKRKRNAFLPPSTTQAVPTSTGRKKTSQRISAPTKSILAPHVPFLLSGAEESESDGTLLHPDGEEDVLVDGREPNP
jgi:hypothetical protein